MRRIGGLLSLCLLLLAVAIPAGANAATVYPTPGGSTFDSGTDGWAESSNGCGLLGIPNVVCSVQNRHAAAKGNGPGSLETEYNTVAGVLGLATGTGQFTSPLFQLTGPGPNTGATFVMDRRADIKALLDLGGTVVTRVGLFHQETGTTTILKTETLTAADTNFTPIAPIAVDPSLLVVNDHYQLVVSATFTSILQVALGSTFVEYDNIGLRVQDGTLLSKPFVTTLPATNISGTTATLNSRINPNGLATVASYAYGLDTFYGTAAPSTGVLSIGSGTEDVEPNSVTITGLTPCTTYHFTIGAVNANNTVGAPTFGSDESFRTDCAPDANTLAASPNSAVTAVLNGEIRANGPAGKYIFQYGLTNAYGSVAPVSPAPPAPQNTRSYPESRDGTYRPVIGEPIGGLQPSTTYHARIVAQSDLGTTYGNDVTFTTPPATGPAGPQGTPGTQGAQGAQGIAGAQGVAGPAGKQGPSGLNGSDLVVQNGKGLLKIKSKTVKIGLQGRRAGQIRLPIFCTRKTGRSCAGTFKVRTINKINPSTSGGKYAKRRVTFFTGEYQLKIGAVGVVIGELQPEKLDLARKVKSVAVQLSITVTDSVGNRQTIVQNGRLVARKTV